MGLRKSDSLLPMIVLSGLIVVLGMFGEAGRTLLAYVRAELANGEVWRLISGHFVHLSWSHLMLNLFGLWLVWYLVADAYKVGQWCIALAALIVGIDIGFWFFETQLAWYVGLSGVLHGLLAAGVVAGVLRGSIESWIIAAVLAVKIGYEQFIGPLPGSELSTGGDVIVAAHLYGAVSGVVVAALLLIRVRAQASI